MEDVDGKRGFMVQVGAMTEDENLRVEKFDDQHY
jgi:hypothetical protein